MKNPQITATWIVSLQHFDIVVRVNGQVIKRCQSSATSFPNDMARLASIMWARDTAARNNDARRVA